MRLSPVPLVNLRHESAFLHLFLFKHLLGCLLPLGVLNGLVYPIQLVELRLAHIFYLLPVLLSDVLRCVIYLRHEIEILMAFLLSFPQLTLDTLKLHSSHVEIPE
jgi:hypothetical protein